MTQTERQANHDLIDDVTSTSDGHGVRTAWSLSRQSLRAGMRLTENLYDPDGQVILPSRTTVTTEFLEGLAARGVDVVHVACPAPTIMTDATRGKYERQLDDLLARMLQADADGAGPRTPRRTPIPAVEHTHEARSRLDQHLTACSVIEDVARGCCRGATQLAHTIEETVGKLLNLAAIDAELLPLIISLQQPQNEYLFDHCVNVSLLSMAVGARMGLDENMVFDLGTGSLLLDVGMLRIPEAIRLAPRALTADERIEVNRHTLYTLDALQRVEGLSAVAPFVGYQVHERNDGSGYPRGRSGMFIHQFAKIAAVVDIYCAMIRPRPHRPAWLPYLAMKEVLLEGSRGRLDRTAIRALLDCLSLFPVGSLVELDGNVHARVVQANPGNHTRPVVVEVDRAGEPTGQAVDLQKETSRRVVRAIANDS